MRYIFNLYFKERNVRNGFLSMLIIPPSIKVPQLAKTVFHFYCSIC